MGVRATITVLSLAMAVGCGEPFTFTASSSGGGGAGGTTVASTTSTSVSTGTGTPIPCTWSPTGNTCGDGAYCDACTGGKCAPLPTSPTFESAPVCGCEGITYWNVSTAESVGVPSRHAGVCSDSEAKKCSKDSECPRGVCSHDLTMVPLGCGSPVVGLACVGLPASCAQTTVMGKECLKAECTNACQLLHDGKRWTTSNCN